tara:strand:+ start:37 stop:657 length:621 start_codon:yes stop_codon:yes gene_type:complete
MNQQRKEFIKQAHSAACSEWKEKIESEFPKLFKKYELVVGKWYKHGNNNFNHLMVWNNAQPTYGFFDGKYRDDYCFRDTFNKIPATDKEVSEALIAEARKRGYKNGNYECMTNNTINTFKVEDSFFLSGEKLWMGEAGFANLIFKNGIWAEIIEEPVYEWRYVYINNGLISKVSEHYYTSKKDFSSKALSFNKPLKKVKVSKRIRK